MKIVSWNVNGIRTFLKNDKIKLLQDLIEDNKPSIICFQETKLSCPIFETENALKEKIDGFKYRYWSPCLSKPGYSGTAVFSKKKPLNVTYGISDLDDTFDDEGRVITLEFKDFFLVNVYTANSGEGLKRLDYRIKTWDTHFRNYVKGLNKKKPIIITGDLNVAHNEIDLHNPKTNQKSAGFTKEERESFSKLLSDVDLIDTYRHLYPDKVEYSYWTYLFNSRSKNKGWRIDYFLVSKNKLGWVKDSKILTDIMGSDHAPVLLKISL